MRRGQCGDGFGTGPGIALERAQAHVARLRHEQRQGDICFGQVGQRRVAQLVESPAAEGSAEERLCLAGRQTSTTGHRTQIDCGRRTCRNGPPLGEDSGPRVRPAISFGSRRADADWKCR